ncbi:MAG: NAD-dependent dehydratase [Gemmatales bacterium]|nr:MAG: NAD-dependent dehydratase [Gemmatales bacterium]
MIQHHQASPTNPTRVVLLGGSGFVGQNLSSHLQSAGIKSLSLSSKDVNLIHADAIDKLRRIIQKDDAVVVASALTPDKGKDIGTFMRNLHMVEHLSAVFETNPCAHIIYISSDGVYADGENPIRETTPTNPGNLYGWMHVAREQMIQYAAQKHQVPIMLLRPCAIYGAGDTHNSYGPNRFCRAALGDGIIKLFGNGEEKRDHLFVDDFSRMIIACLQHRSAGVLNVASGKSVSFFEVAELVARLSQRPVKVEGTPRQNPITHRHFDVTEQIKAFPTFSYTPIEKGIAATIAGLRKKEAA